MRVGIAHKLILAFLGLTLVLLLLTLGLARWSFERGFLDYGIALEQERLERLAAQLVKGYARAGGHWAWLDQHGFARLLADLAPSGIPGPGRPPGASGGRPPHHYPPPPDWAPPPQRWPPTALLDASGQHLAGVKLDAARSPPVRASRGAQVNALAGEPEWLRIPIEFQGKPIGELVSQIPPRRFNTPQATAFARQQSLASLWIGLSGLVVAVLLSWLLARTLLAPLREVMAALSRLSAGDFSHRPGRARSDEIGQLMAGIDQLSQTLAANRSARQRWLADISHELRTPVTILHGEIELLKDGLRPFNQRQLHSLDEEVSRLRRLIEDLYALSLADVGGLRYRFAPVELRAIVRAALERVRARAAASGLSLRIEPMAEIWIIADAARLDQLIANLLENSLAYTDAPGDILLQVTRASREVTIRIQDTPPAPATEDLDRLFEPLYRPDGSRSRRRAGAGLGLAICNNIVAAHQGRMSARPSSLGGLCVEVVLPAGPDSANSPMH